MCFKFSEHILDAPFVILKYYNFLAFSVKGLGYNLRPI